MTTDVPLGWSHPVATVPERGLDLDRRATTEECEAVRAALDILGCSRIAVQYRVRGAGAGCYRVTGSLAVDLTQACVATAEPVEQQIELEFEALFHPEGSEARSSGRDEMDDPFAETTTESISNGEIEVGRVVYEEIASALDPYPRLAGSTFDWKDPKDADGLAARPNPFAKLAALKRTPPGQDE